MKRGVLKRIFVLKGDFDPIKGINMMDLLELIFAFHKNTTFVERFDTIFVLSGRLCKNMIGGLPFLHIVIYFQSNIGG